MRKITNENLLPILVILGGGTLLFIFFWNKTFIWIISSSNI